MGSFLGAYRSKRVAFLIGLGFASGLPLQLSGGTLTAWMTRAGVNIKTVGLFALVSLPYSFKFIWAPLLDRYRLPWLGRRRGWMALSQLGLALAILALSTMDPVATPSAMALCALMVAFLSASQDVVTDAYRTDLLPPNERASGTSTFILGYRVALLISGGLAFVLAQYMSWPRVFQFLGFLLLPAAFLTWRSPEPEATRPPRDLQEAVVLPFKDFFGKNYALLALLFVMFYKFGDYIAGGMITPFLIKTGFRDDQIGYWSKIAGFIPTVLGTLLGGGLVAKLGVRKCLLTMGVLQAATNSGYLALAIVGKSLPLLISAIAIDNFCGGMATVAFSAFTMSLCNKSYSATQFALLTSASTIIGRLTGAGSGYIVSSAGWPFFFALTMVVAIPALFILSRIPAESTEPAALP